MKRKIKIGLTRSLIYYRYGVLLKNFFTNLNCKVLVPPENINIKKYNNKCIPYQNYINNIEYLKDKCDYIIISSVYNYGQNNKTCPIFNYNKENILNIITKRQVLEFNIKYTSISLMINTIIKMGLIITKNIPKIIYSYEKAKKKQINYDNNLKNYQKNLLNKEQKKILIMSPFYIIEDTQLTKKIINIFKRYNIIPIFTSRLDKKTAYTFSKYYPEEIGNKYIKEMIGAYYYYQHIISGVIYISSINCEIDKLIKNISFYNKIKHPLINIYIYDDIENKIKKIIKELI